MNSKTNPKKFLIILFAFLISTANAKADFTFGEPTNLGPIVNSSANDGTLSISADGLALYVGSTRPGGYGSYDIWVATRETIDDDWGSPANLGPTVNSSSREVGPEISADGLTLYFFSDRPGGHGDRDLWMSTRLTTNDPWGEPVNLGQIVNSLYRDTGPNISSDGLTLYFVSNRPGGYGERDIWVTTRSNINEPWGEPVNLGPPINTSYRESGSYISADNLMLFLPFDRPGGAGGLDIWVATRPTSNDPWGDPVNLGSPINTSNQDAGPTLYEDGFTLYFTSDRPGGFGSRDLYQAPIIPIADLNSDGIVDADDMCIIVDHWGTDEPLCDIGPMPWGDGIVDVQDLIVLAEHLFEEIPPAELVE